MLLTAALMLAIAACITALVCVVVLMLLVRRDGATGAQATASRSWPVPTIPATMTVMSVPTVTMHPAGSLVVQAPTGATRSGTYLVGTYPGLSTVLGTWLHAEPDPVERVRIAHDLGTVGDAPAARALLEGVGAGVVTPTIAADQLQRCGFEAGVLVGACAASHGLPPRVQALAEHLGSGASRAARRGEPAATLAGSGRS